MPDPAKPEETLSLIQGLAEVVQKQQAAQKAQNEAHLKAMEKTHEQLTQLYQSVDILSKALLKSSASLGASQAQGIRLPNVTLPEYAGKQNIDRFLTQMESLLKSSAVPVKFWLTYLKQQCQKDSRAYDALLEAEKKYSKTFDPVKASDDEHYMHFTNCIALLKEKRGIPRDQQIRDLLSQYYTIKQAQRESVADFSHRFSEVQNELEKLIPGIHRTADGELELIHAFSIKLLPEISKEIVSREFKYKTLREIITVASRYEQNVLFSGSKEPHLGNSQPGVMYSQPHFEGP